MDKPKQVTEEFLKNETKTELDAIHPRFLEPQDAEVVRKYQIENDFYCDECNLFFAPNIRGLKVHFDGEMVKHRGYASCFYCQCPVYQYKFKNESKLYHDCRDWTKEQETHD